MADMSGLGDLVLTVGGDISPLTEALQEVPGVAQNAAAQIQAAFDAIPSATENVETSLSSLSTGLTEAGHAAGETAGEVQKIPPALQQTHEAAEVAVEKLKEFITTGLELAGITLTLEGLKEVLTEIVSGFEQLDRARISLTALTGSAEAAVTTLDQLKLLAVGDALSLPALIQAQQRMTALGISATQAAPLLQAAANAAAAMGNDFSTVVNIIDRMAIAGTVMARGLAQIGITTHDLAQAMGVADDAVKAAFKDLDQSERINVLITAMQKFNGVAAALADTLTGRWQSFKTSVEIALEGVGEAIATGLTGAVAQAQTSVVPAIEAIADAFRSLAAVIGPIVMPVVNSFIQGIGDFVTTAATAISAAANLAQGHGNLAKSVQDDQLTWQQLIDVINTNLNIWHIAADEINILRGSISMMQQDAQIMAQRFGTVTDSIKGFIDKTTAGHDSLLAIRSDFDDLKQALADAKTYLDQVTDAYNKGMASAGQLEAATKAVAAAQTALTGTTQSGIYSLQSYKTEFDGFKAALVVAQTNLTTVATAYANGAASLKQYDTALAAVKTAQDNLNGSMRMTPAEDVAKHLQDLNDNLSHAQRFLDAVTEAMKTNAQAAALLAGAQKGVADAQAALNVSAQTTTTTISASSPKVIEVGNAFSDAATKVKGFVGPIQDMGVAIQGATGITSTMVNGVQVLREKITDLSATAKEGASAARVFADGWKDAATVIANAAKTIVSAAEQSFQQTVADSQAAMQSVESLSSELDRTMAGPNEGGGTLGLHMSLRPGDVITGPQDFFTPPGQFGGTDTGTPGGGLFGPIGAQTSMLFGTPQELIAYAQSLQQFARSLNTATPSVTSAADALTTAATTQQDAAQAAYDAAKAATVGTQQTTAALSTAADSISASALHAADLANQAAFDNSQMVTSTVNAVNAVAAAASNTMVAAATVVAAVATKAGIVAPSNTLVGPVGATQFSVPSFTPGGSNTAGLAPAAFTPFFQPTVGGTGPVTINVQGSQFVQQLMDEFIRNMQSQGIRLTRG